MTNNKLLNKFKSSVAYKYAKWCIEEDNDKVGIWIKKQCIEWLKIANGEVDYAYIDLKMFNKIGKLLKMMNLPDNPKKTIYESLDRYGWFFIVATLCTKDIEGSRFYETSLLEISRKNHKTYNSGLIFIISMLIEPKFARFFSVAPDYKLSSELKLAVKKIIGVSPLLQSHFKVCRDFVKCFLTEIEYIPLAYSNDGMDGKLANIFLADEAGLLDDYPVEAMRSSQIELDNKLGIIISTQYPNEDNVLLTEIDYAKKVLDNLVDDKRYFSLLYEPNNELIKDWQTNDLCIYQSNPVAVDKEKVFKNIKKKRATAILYESKRENYLCKHNNIRYKSLGVEAFIDINEVKQCRVDDFDWTGKKVYIGLDLSITEDNTSVAMCCEHEGLIYSKVWGFIPSERIEEKSYRERLSYNTMISNGWCFDCGDKAIDYEFVEGFILNLEKEYGVEIMQIGYDRANCMSTAQKLESGGYETVVVKQHSMVLHPPTKLLKESILNKKFRYDINKLLEINFQNARCTEDTNKNKYVNKKKSAEKVDMVVSLINALYLLQQELLNESWFSQ